MNYRLLRERGVGGRGGKPEILRAHAGECVDEALRHGTMQQKRKKIVELVNLFERVR